MMYTSQCSPILAGFDAHVFDTTTVSVSLKLPSFQSKAVEGLFVLWSPLLTLVLVLSDLSMAVTLLFLPSVSLLEPPSL